MKKFSIFLSLLFLLKFSYSNSQNKIASYLFNGNSIDESGNGNHATGYNGPTLTTDRFGNPNSAYLFDGTNDYMSIPHSDVFNANSISISSWVYPISTPSPYNGFINKKDSTSNLSTIKSFGTAANSQMIRVSTKFSDGTQYEPSIATGLTLNQWNHVVYIIDNGTLKVYLNGNLVLNDNTYSGYTLSTNTAPLTIGVTYWFPSATFNKYYWNGKIDDINIYDSALTDCQVAALYNENSGLIASYPFNGDALDVSGNNQNGTMFNGVESTTDRFGNPNAAFLFDGVNDYISIPSSSSFNTDVFTISGWIYPISTPSSYHGFINKKDSLTNVTNINGFGTSANTSMIRFSAKFTDGTGYEPSESNGVTVNHWNHVVYVYNFGTIKIYLDGNLVLNDNTSNGKTITKTSAPITIGVTYWFPSQTFEKYYWNGKIDDIKIYNRELSSCEIADLYTPGNVTGILPSSGNNVKEIKAYPNPVKDHVSFDLTAEDLKAKISILDATGIECKDVTLVISNSTVTANFASMKNGIYFLKINNNGIIKSTKIIKE